MIHFAPFLGTLPIPRCIGWRIPLHVSAVSSYVSLHGIGSRAVWFPLNLDFMDGVLLGACFDAVVPRSGAG